MSALKVWSTSEREVTIRLLDLSTPAQLSFGDGTEPVGVNPATGFVRHVYERAGAYTITLKDGSTVLSTERVFARSGDAPVVSWAPGEDNPNFIDFTWEDEPTDLVSIYDVVWGDGQPNDIVTAPHGFIRAHGYAAGDYTVKIYDRQAKRWGQYDITVHDKVYDPDLTVEQGTGQYEAVVTISALGAPGKEVKVWWGDGLDPDVIANAQVGDQVRHTYDFDDTYLVQIGYSDGTGEGGAVFVDIPWLARAVKPTSRIEWSPEPEKALGVRAKWQGSGWDYTLHWGDGTQERVRWQDPPTPHVYQQPGTYTVTGVSDLHADWTASVTVTVRSSTAPTASFMLVAPDSNRVRAALGSVAEPVRYQVSWGDNTVTEHDSGDLQPVHEYAWETSAPQILVRDMPAKRVARFTGPAIGPDPVAAPVSGWFFKHVPTEDETDYRRFALIGGGLNPGEEVTWWPWSNEWTRTATANAGGQVRDEIDIPISKYPFDDFNTWRSYTVELPDGSLRFVPVHRTRTGVEPDVTYEIDSENTAKLWISVSPQMLGEHRVSFSDGTSETVNVTSLPLRVAHTFSGPAFSNITVTLPDGREVKGEANVVRPCPPSFNYNYPGQVGITWYYPPESCGERGRDVFSPIIVDDGYHRRIQLHCPNVYRDTGEPNGWHSGFSFGGFPAGLYNVLYRSPFQKERVHEVRVTAGAQVRQVGPPEIAEVRLPDVDANDITAWFGDVTEWEGGYSGNFYVSNNTESPVAWQIEFSLADPARVREVWPDAAQFTDLGNGRWRIWSDLPLNESIVVGARIEPPGETKQFPDDIAGRARDVPPSGGDEEG